MLNYIFKKNYYYPFIYQFYSFSSIRNVDIKKLSLFIKQQKINEATQLFRSLILNNDTKPPILLYSATIPNLIKYKNKSLLTEILDNMKQNNIPMTSDMQNDYLYFLSQCKDKSYVFSYIPLNYNKLGFYGRLSILKGIIEHDNDFIDFNKCINLFEQSNNNIPLPVSHYNELLKYLININKIKQANNLVEYMKQSKTPPTIDTYKRLISCYINKNFIGSAIYILENIKETYDIRKFKSSIQKILVHCANFSTTKKKKEKTLEYTNRIMKIHLDSSIIRDLMLVYEHIEQYNQVEYLYNLLLEKDFMITAQHYRIILYCFSKSLQFDKICYFLDEFERKYNDIHTGIYESILQYFCENKYEKESLYIFDKMPNKTLKAFHFIILLYTSLGKDNMLPTLLKDMKSAYLVPSIETYHVIIKGLIKSNNNGSKRAYSFLINASKDNTIYIKSINYIINSFIINNKDIKTAVSILLKMEKLFNGIKPDITSYSIIIHSLCNTGLISEAKEILNIFKQSNVYEKQISIYNSFLQAYFNISDKESIQQLLNEIKHDNIVKHRSTYAIIICGFYKLNLIPEVTEYIYESYIENKFPKTPKEKILFDSFQKKGISSNIIEYFKTLCPNFKDQNLLLEK